MVPFRHQLLELYPQLGLKWCLHVDRLIDFEITCEVGEAVVARGGGKAKAKNAKTKAKTKARTKTNNPEPIGSYLTLL